jgi:hypothetical protein
MRGILLFNFFLPLFALGQSKSFPTKTTLAKIYSQAIADFIKDANKRNKINFDTLYFGKRKNDQPDDFPEIELPETIKNTQIRLISPKLGEQKQKERKSSIYINMVGWVERKKAEFLFYVFSNGFEQQYNYAIYYKYNFNRKEYEFVSLRFIGPPFDK